MRESSVKFCPVPSEQQPVNEYEQLKDSWFFRWATLSNIAYGRKLIWAWFWGLLISGPITAASFVPREMPVKFLLCAAGGAGLLVMFIILRLYLGWSYIGDRLKKEKIFYEESGWYDGQVWEKPIEVLQRDLLIFSYQVIPILKRLRNTGLGIATLMVVGTLIWLIL